MTDDHDNASLNRRLGRVFSAILDATSYKTLWSSVADNLIRPDATEIDAEAVNDRSIGYIDAHESEGIPKIIFQTWKTRNRLPRNYGYWRTTFLKHNPTYRHILWDDTDNRNFIASRFPWFLDMYDRYPAEIYRADVIRLFFLYSYGGFYSDMDSECIRPLDDLRDIGDVLVGRMGKNVDFEHSIPNATMASKPRQVFWLLTIALLTERFNEATRKASVDEMGPEELTGPILLKTAAEYYTSHSRNEIVQRASPTLHHFEESEYHFGKLIVLPRQVWYPIDWTNPLHQVFRRKMSRSGTVLSEDSAQRRFRGSYVVNYWSHSWDGNDGPNTVGSAKPE
jgi:inositol phosphorylceramide mannosyltransferase catalytic subunit